MTAFQHDPDYLVREDFENVREMFPEHPMPPWEELTDAEKAIARAAYAQKSGFFRDVGEKIKVIDDVVLTREQLEKLQRRPG